MTFKNITFLILLFLTSMGSVRAGLLDFTEMRVLDHLFNENNFPKIQKPNKKTFVFWINGDASHYRPESSIPDAKIIQIDLKDRKKVQSFSLRCRCNVVILHDQRGSDRWYLPRKKFGAYLWVYSGGKLISTKGGLENVNAPEVNQTYPIFLSLLLDFTQKVFPLSDLYFFYRGHSFRTPYNKDTKKFTLPFDYSAKNHSYGIEYFIQGIKGAELKRKLKLITFTSCSMAYAKLAFDLAQYAESMIASQVLILETGTTSFNYSFLENINDFTPNASTIKAIAKTLLINFKQLATPRLEKMRETPLSIIDLKKLAIGSSLWSTFLSNYLENETITPSGAADFKLSIYPSEAYIAEKKAKGINEKIISLIIEQFSSVNTNPLDPSIDLISFLPSLINDYPEDGQLKALKKLLEDSIEIHDNPSFSPKKGLSLFLK